MSSTPRSGSDKGSDRSGTGTTIYPYRFGEVGIMLGVLDRQKVKSSLTAQLELKSNNQKKPLGQIMLGQGWLTEKMIDSILIAQKRFRTEQQEKLDAQGNGKGSAPASGESSPPKAPARSKKKMLGRYELLAKLGEGSMGAVFKAMDTEVKRVVALKVLPKDLAGDKEFLARFKREVKTMAALSHPNIVTFYESGQASGYWYLTMEFVDGGSLFSLLKGKGRMVEKEALRIATDIAKALSYAHQQSLIHRDIKPENILFSKDGVVKVTDFGLAKSQQDTSKLTAVGMSIGTPHYLSPEQAMGAEDVDHRADLYSLGATLFHLLTGKVPFDHVSSTKVMVMHVQDPPPDPRSLVPGISRGAAQLVLRLMAKKPSSRFESASEVLSAIEKVKSGGQVKAIPKGNTTGGLKPVKGRFKWLSKSGCLGRAGIFMGVFALAVWVFYLNV